MTKVVQYSTREGERICELIALGFTWKQITQRTGRSYRVIMRWARRSTEFQRDIVRARSESAHVANEHIRALERRVVQAQWIYPLDDAGLPRMTKTGKLIKIPNPDWIDPSAANVAIRSMQWRMARLNRADYRAY